MISNKAENLRKLKRILINICLCAVLSLSAFGEQWRLHPTFSGDVERVIDTPEHVYLLSNNQYHYPWTVDNARRTMSLFRYEKDGEELVWLNRQNKLSGTVLQAAEYNPDKKYLLVAYDNGNIDLLHDNGDVTNIPGFMLADARYSKNVNAIGFNPSENMVLVATDFGYISIDDDKGEVLFTRELSRSFNGIASLGDKLVLADSEGLYAGLISDRSFTSFEKINGYRDVERVVRLGDNRIIVSQIYGWGGEVRALTLDAAGALTDKLLINYYIKSLELNRAGVTVSGYDEIWDIDKDLNMSHYPKYDEDKDTKLASWDQKTCYVARGMDGICIRRLGEDGAWTLVNEGIVPNASNAYKCDNMVYHPSYGMLVRNHGISQTFVSQDVNTPDYISSLKGLEWSPMSPAFRYPSPMFEQWNPKGIAVDPRNPDHVYSGSVLHGLMRLDLANPSNSLRLSRDNDPGKIGDRLVVVQPAFKEFEASCPFSAPAFDDYGNLWATWWDFDLWKGGQDCAEIWYWTPEDRLASQDAASYKPMKRIKLPGAGASNYSVIVPLHGASSRNILMYISGGWESCPIFIDHKGTLDNQNDDERTNIQHLIDQDGSEVDFAYILSVFEDASTGLVWLGLDKGVVNFRPADIIRTGGRVNRIKVSRNDGTNLADYLLDGVWINCITSDPSGRKWFGTNGGGIVVTSSDGTEVLRTYTSSGSELPDDAVYGICYNPDNNSMMISTDKGLAELYLSTATSSGSKSNAVAYPNPVRPDYFGYVTIEGLADNALVKIVDAGGGLIKEVGFAAGGEARWDVTNLNSKRVPGGVYYVMASGSPDGDSFSAVAKILVVN